MLTTLMLAPGTSGVVLSETDCAEEGDPTAPDRTAFRSRIGSLLWLCRGALPIIGYGWTGHKPGSGLSDRLREPLGVFASLYRF
jgi:hypothetical protein